jgi:hypothetical protein
VDGRIFRNGVQRKFPALQPPNENGLRDSSPWILEVAQRLIHGGQLALFLLKLRAVMFKLTLKFRQLVRNVPALGL